MPRDAQREKIMTLAALATQHLTRCDIACSWTARGPGQVRQDP